MKVVTKRGPFVAVVSADVSRAEFFLVFSKEFARPKRVKDIKVRNAAEGHKDRT